MNRPFNLIRLYRNLDKWKSLESTIPFEPKIIKTSKEIYRETSIYMHYLLHGPF